jgi:hypothetical protein
MISTIVQDLKILLSKDSIIKERKKLDELINLFKKLKNESDTDEDVNKLLASDLINELNRKIFQEKEKIQKEAEKIKSEKENLIKNLDQLIKNEQNIGKAFGELKQIREQWTKLNEKVPFEQKDVDRKFTKSLEDFYYNINIYKAIQEHDLKRNQQHKEVILQKLKNACSSSASTVLMKEIKNLKTQWESIGPVKKELQDEFWSKYRNYLDHLYSNFKDYKESEREKQIRNLEMKKEIIQFINQINSEHLDSLKDWKFRGEKVLEKQSEWKSIGFVPKESKDKLWKEYRNVCDVFFKEKKEFYEKIKVVYKTNKKLKTELCNKAELLLESENFEDLTKDFITIQTEWKKIGPVHQKDEQHLWNKFQKHCNDFFSKKKESKKQLDAEKDSINTQKESIIIELKELNTPSDSKLLEIIIKWWNTNKEYTRKSNQLLKEFLKTFESKSPGKAYQEFENDNILKKIEIYSLFNDNGNMLLREKRAIQDKIESDKKEISQYENNLSFFSSSKKTGSLMSEVYLKMDNLSSQIETQKSKLKLISSKLKETTS